MKKVAWMAFWMCLSLVLGMLNCLGSEIVISEIAWAGTAAGPSDEWIELHNQGEVAVDLAGWRLLFGDAVILLGEAGEDTLEVRTTMLAPGEFLILERTNDDTISDMTADLLYKGGLSNAGVVVELRNPEDVVVDSVQIDETGWPAGTASDGEPPYCSLERTGAGGWSSNNGIIRNGLDAVGDPLNGTPGQANSADILAQWAPTVELTYPSDAASILSGIELVSWIASDPNDTESALSISILISESDGDDWVLLIENLANTGSFSWDTTAHVSGAKYRIRVRALDPEGYFGEDTSLEFEISNSGD